MIENGLFAIYFGAMMQGFITKHGHHYVNETTLSEIAEISHQMVQIVEDYYDVRTTRQ